MKEKEEKTEPIINRIAIVDDSDDQRDTYKKRLSLFLIQKGSTLEVIDTYPFTDPLDYFEWIEKENIIALIFDEKLHMESKAGFTPVDYSGSTIVLKIRERKKDIPIFTLTNYPEDAELQQVFNEYEYILSKDNFTDKHVDIILRAYQRYLIENQKELSQFNELSKKIACGNAEGDDLIVLHALQLKLQMPFTNNLKDREDWLQAYEAQIQALKKIKEEIETNLIKK